MFGVLFASIEQRLELRPANCARLAGKRPGTSKAPHRNSCLNNRVETQRRQAAQENFPTDNLAEHPFKKVPHRFRERRG
jgi:hypothetical protein